MSAHIERLVDGQWHYVTGDVYDGRSYPLFGRLAGVRNHEGLEPLDDPRGLPDGLNGGQYSRELHDARYVPPAERPSSPYITSWFTLRELERVDWEEFFSRYSGGEHWFDVLEKLRNESQGDPDAVRLIFWFDDTIADLERHERRPAPTT